MDHYRINIRDNSVNEALRDAASEHGRSVEEELAALVEKTYVATPKKSKKGNGDWVNELIKLGRGLDLQIPESRSFVRYAPAYPKGMEPRDGETFVDHISRISRPGIDLEIERDRTPHEGPEL